MMRLILAARREEDGFLVRSRGILADAEPGRRGSGIFGNCTTIAASGPRRPLELEESEGFEAMCAPPQRDTPKNARGASRQVRQRPTI
jgi:hypothetical protein